MASRNLNDCVPELIAKYILAEEKCRAIGIFLQIFCTARTVSEQVALWLQGRRPLESVNAARRVAGLKEITEAENRYCVTWTTKSAHIVDATNPLSRAIDFGLKKQGINPWDLKADTNGDNEADFDQVGEIMESVGLKWGVIGADGVRKDKGHVQLAS